MYNDLRRFAGLRPANQSFSDVQTDLRTTPLYFPIDLSTARSIAAGTALTINIAGNVMYVDQKPNSGIATMHIQDDSSAAPTPITVFPGFLARVPFTRIVIENDAQPAQVMNLIYGVDLNLEPGISPGTGFVNVVDGGKARTLAKIAYSAIAPCGPSAATYAHAQLRMGVTNYRAIVKKIYVSSDTSGPFRVGLYTPALATLLTPGSSKNLSTPTSAQSQAFALRENNAAQLGSNFIHYGDLQANIAQVIEWTEPVVVTLTGLVVHALTPNTTLNVTFEFFEETF